MLGISPCPRNRIPSADISYPLLGENLGGGLHKHIVPEYFGSSITMDSTGRPFYGAVSKFSGGGEEEVNSAARRIPSTTDSEDSEVYSGTSSVNSQSHINVELLPAAGSRGNLGNLEQEWGRRGSGGGKKVGAGRKLARALDKLLPRRKSSAAEDMDEESFDRALAYASKRNLEDSKRERIGGIRASLKVKNDETELDRAAVLVRRRSMLENIEEQRAMGRSGDEANPKAVELPKKDSPTRRSKGTNDSSLSSSLLER
mmetsp:Transcript_6741/g.13072  ORF Transcript_6741/g.13072 Transcript_6741/m.13072 type:complete len:258 (+) Transcript_6741:208-981(+)